MKRKLFFSLLLSLRCLICFAQDNSGGHALRADVVDPSLNDSLERAYSQAIGLGLQVRQGGGYIVYRNDTIWGEVFINQHEVTLEKRMDNKHNFIVTHKLNDLKLKTVMMYNNSDKKQLCLTRVKKDDKKMMRVIHEGKLNIYDGRIDYIYKPEDIDKNLIVIAYDKVVDDLSSFLTENTKRDLIGYINDIYGLKINPREITWKGLLVKLDMLD